MPIHWRSSIRSLVTLTVVNMCVKKTSHSAAAPAVSIGGSPWRIPHSAAVTVVACTRISPVSRLELVPAGRRPAGMQCGCNLIAKAPG